MSCRKSQILLPLLSGELSEHDRAALTTHIQECSSCKEELDRLTEIHKYLLSVPRPSVPQTLYRDYVDALKKRFMARPFPIRLAVSLYDFIKMWLISSRWEWRIARAAVVLLIGLFIGRAVWVEKDGAETSMVQGWSFQDPEMIALNDFVSGSEVLLLTLLNSNPELLQTDDVLLAQQLARSLLNQTRPIRQSALFYENELLPVFLDHLELVLLEISNRNEEEMRASLQELQQQIRQARIVQTSRLVQSRLVQSNREGV